MVEQGILSAGHARSLIGLNNSTDIAKKIVQKKNILSVKYSKTNITSKFTYQIEELGLKPSVIHRNLSSKELIKMSVERNEGILTKTGALSVTTGQFTGRSPEDRFIVDDKKTHKTVDWGKINKPF